MGGNHFHPSIFYCIFVLPEMLKLTTRKGKGYYLRYLLNYPRAVYKIRSLIRRHDISLVHTNSIHNLYGFLAAKLARRPHIWHVREIVVQSRFLCGLQKFLLTHATERIVVTSEAVQKMFFKHGNSPPHLQRIPNGIDVEEFRPSVQDGRRLLEDLRLEDDTPLIGMVCRLDRWKGISSFLRAAPICHQNQPKARFVIVSGEIEGGRDFADEMYQLAAALHLQNIVYFTGWRYLPEDMPSVHASLSVLVLPSELPEPFGLVLLEAMASAKPVIATNQGGPAEICVQDSTGILIPPSDPERLAEALLLLLCNPAKARAMGSAGRKRVEELYDVRTCIRQLQNLYSDVLTCAESQAS